MSGETHAAGGGGEETVNVHPRRIIYIGAVFAALVLAGPVALAIALGGMAEGAITFHFYDQAGIVSVGVLGAAAIMLVARPRVKADATGMQVRNILGETFIPWPAVVRIAFPPGAHWAQIVLDDEELYPLMAIQAMDKERAVTALRQVRELCDRYRPELPQPSEEDLQRARRRAQAEAAAAAARPLGRLEIIDREMAAKPSRARRGRRHA